MLRRKAKREVHITTDETPSENKRRKAVVDNGDEESDLERLVFGAEHDLFAKLDRAVETKSSDSEDESDEDHDGDDDKPGNIAADGHAAKWVDKDDDIESIDVSAEAKLRKLRDTKDQTILRGTKYTQKLRTQFEKIYGDGNWASLEKKKKKRKDSEGDGSTDDDDDDEILARTGRNLATQSERLPKGLLSIKRVKDANAAKPANVTVQSLEFHPSAKVLLTAGLNKTLDIFQVDGKENPKLQSVFVNRFPIHNAHFTCDGEQVIMSSRRKYFYVYDMIKGQVTRIPGIRGRHERNLEKFKVSPDGKHLVFLGDNGYMILLSSKTKQWVGNLKMNGSVKDVTFSADGSRMYSTGSDGEVYVWDMTTRSCVHKFVDDGCLTGTALAASKDGKYLACGSDSGIVNIYDDQCLLQSQPRPLKSVTNLVTSVTGTQFNSSSEILAISSRVTKDAFKLVHLPSMTAFSSPGPPSFTDIVLFLRSTSIQ
ncbi:U3 small nucleolar RNA-associated protein 18 homolog isoform X2 [Nematostella vectensis]|uniref:U3 small nucleolar RNA-associated protein 18 homolog isoform X2 n=1 Tax=Nematostella vectensis TaxID=45351 RepID=UPI0020771ED5|nr:U3 small nucleolar RNA-associated protein 18 homolog isoform X2 [Nematostella vectensis]